MSFDGPYDHGDGPPPAAGWWVTDTRAAPLYDERSAGPYRYPDQAETGSTPPASEIKATRFEWRDPSLIPPREWLYGKHIIRQYVSALFAAGGLGKTSLGVVEALAMVSGRKLIGEQPHEPLNVWLINLEDPRDEMERRIAAAALDHTIDPQCLNERLFLDIGRERPIVTAEMTRDGAKIIRPVIEAIEREIQKNNIDVVILDPFVSSHRVTENDNMAIDLVAKEWAAIAGRTNCAIELVHHVRKLRGEDAAAEDGRGGGALLSAVRAARVLNVMSPETAKGFGISEKDRRSYIRVDDGKANLTAMGEPIWRQIKSVNLGNKTAERPEDWVGVVGAWTPPNPLDGIKHEHLGKVQDAIDGRKFRENVQATDWVGYTIGDVIGINARSPDGKAKIKGLIKIWIANDGLRIIEIIDKKGNKRPVVEVGVRARS